MGKKPKKKVSLKERKKLKMRNVDMTVVKMKMKKEFLQTFGSLQSHSSCNGNGNYAGNEKNYEYWYSKYLTEEFNSHFVIMLMTYLESIAIIPSKIKNDNNINKELLTIIKELMMNEFEITLFTINLDQIGWDVKDIKHKLHWLYIGLLTKAQLNHSIEMFILHFNQQYHQFRDCFTKWKCHSNEEKNMTMAIYDRYKLLNKPFNTFCEKRFVDYNSIVDKIVQLSQPYGQDNKGIMIVKEETTTNNNNFDLLNIPSFQEAQQGLQDLNNIGNTNTNLNVIDNARSNLNSNNSQNNKKKNNQMKDKKINDKSNNSFKNDGHQEGLLDSMNSKNGIFDFNNSSQKPFNDFAQNILYSQNSLLFDQNSFLCDNNIISSFNNSKLPNYKQIHPLNDSKLFSSQNSSYFNMINLSQLSNNL